MRVNFFVIFPNAELANVPATRLPRTASRAMWVATRELDRRLAREFPNITAIDVTAQLDQVQGVVSQVIQGRRRSSCSRWPRGLIVLLAALASTREARRASLR